MEVEKGWDWNVILSWFLFEHFLSKNTKKANASVFILGRVEFEEDYLFHTLPLEFGYYAVKHDDYTNY
jgi:hypothetical protein